MAKKFERPVRDTRSLLISAAAHLLDEGGPEGVTLRDVGRKAGVSHNAPYKHFASKEDLLAAVASREFSIQTETATEFGLQQTPIEGLRRMMHNYVAWAQKYPARFRLAFGAWTHEPQELGKAASAARARLTAAVEAAQKAGDLPTGDAERIASLILSLAHGAADLALGGHLSKTGKGRADPAMLVNDLIDLLQTPRSNKRGKSR